VRRTSEISSLDSLTRMYADDALKSISSAFICVDPRLKKAFLTRIFADMRG
jgi:hypothetical protein